MQVFAVLNHEPFALLILPVLAIAALGVRRDWSRALMATSPGLLAFLLAVWNKGTTSQVACLRDDLQRLGLLGPTEMPGSSITELALSRPSFFTWDLSASQLGWTLLHGLAMSLVAVLAYALVVGMGSSSASASGSPPLVRAIRLWTVQLAVASPLLLTTVDYGRWFAMLFCAGLGLLLVGRPEPTRQINVGPILSSGGLFAVALAGLELVLLPTGCCTYEAAHIMAVIPYAVSGDSENWSGALHH